MTRRKVGSVRQRKDEEGGAVTDIKTISRDDLRKAAEGMWIPGDGEGDGGRIHQDDLDAIWSMLPDGEDDDPS